MARVEGVCRGVGRLLGQRQEVGIASRQLRPQPLSGSARHLCSRAAALSSRAGSLRFAQQLALGCASAAVLHRLRPLLRRGRFCHSTWRRTAATAAAAGDGSDDGSSQGTAPKEDGKADASPGGDVALKETISVADFLRRRRSLNGSFKEQQKLMDEILEQENEYRRLFARVRQSWEIPEVKDPHLFLLDAFKHEDVFMHIPRSIEDKRTRCFDSTRSMAAGDRCMVTKDDFETSWDCFTESQLRFMNWDNVVAGGGSVTACMAPLPEHCTSDSVGQMRSRRRKYFHDEAYPGSDVDLFLYGLDMEAANKKLVEIHDAVQAACPYEVMCFRSKHTVTLMSQYPFRNIQIVLRLYNSPAEVLMGFDIDSTSCCYDGKTVWAVPRAAMAFATQANAVDMSRRSPSYEMRLAKYAQRGFEVVVPALDRSRVDPFIYEKRFDQVQGLARLLLLERLKTPEARITYQQEQKAKTADGTKKYRIMAALRETLRDRHQLARMDEDAFSRLGSAGTAEMSNYSTVFLPWGPKWNAEKVRRLMMKKDKLLNTVEFRAGRVVKCTRNYKVHICAVGTMEDVIADPWPNDPPVPADVPPEELEQCVLGPISYLVDNPGAQQIGSFYPITEGDWAEGAFLPVETEELIAKCVLDDHEAVAAELAKTNGSPLASRDFLGRTLLHVAALAGASQTCTVLLQQPTVTQEFLSARLANGRNALHLAAMHGFTDIVSMILEKNEEVLKKMEQEEKESESDKLNGKAGDETEKDSVKKKVEEKEVDYTELDIDAADWELKLSPLQYAVIFGNSEVVDLLLGKGASATKQAVHKDKNASLTTLSMCAVYAHETSDFATAERIINALVAAGASSSQVDISCNTIWHYLVKHEDWIGTLEMFLRAFPGLAGTRTLDVLNKEGEPALLLAVEAGNHRAVQLLLEAGATPVIDKATWERLTQVSEVPQYRRMNRSNGIPIAVAVALLDMESVQLFLKQDPSIAKVEVPNSGYDHQRLFTLLDILDSRVSRWKDEQYSHHEKDINKFEKKVAHLEAQLKSCDNGYEKHILEANMAIFQNMLQKCKDDKASSTAVWLDIGEQQEAEPYTRTFALAAEMEKLLLQNGASRTTDDAKADEAQQQSRRRSRNREHWYPQVHWFLAGFNAKHQRRFWSGGNQYLTDETEEKMVERPFSSYTMVDPLEEGYSAYNLHENGKTLPAMLQPRAHRLSTAAFEGNADKVTRLAADGCPVTVDCSVLRANPFWLGTLRGDLATMVAVFEGAQQQYEPEDDADTEGAARSDVKNSLRRLDNIAIMRQGGIEDAGPTAEQMREKLEALQEGLQSITGQGDEKEPKYEGASPECLLASWGNLGAESWDKYLPTLRQLLQRIRALGSERNARMGNRDHEETLPKTVFMTPLHMAILHGKEELVDCILGYAEAFASSMPAGSALEAEEDDTETYVETYEGEKVTIDAKQLRERLLQSFGDLKLPALELAILMDNPDIFLKVARYAKEFALPVGTIALWQCEEEAYRDDEKKVKPGLEHLKKSRWQRRVAERFNESRRPHTLLEFAVHVEAKKISELILSGAADETLLGWLEEDAMALPEETVAAEKRPGRFQVQDGASARRWLVHHIKEKSLSREQLALRLIGPAATDNRGRTALFYAPAAEIPRLLSIPAAALEHRMMGQGATPFLAAVSTGDVHATLALARAGADVTATLGRRKWNALHLLLVSPHMGWTVKEEFLKGLLSEVSDDVAVTLLTAAEAEHTPVMLAVQRDVPLSLLRALLDKMKSLGAIDLLIRRDADMNSSTHIVSSSKRRSPELYEAIDDVAETGLTSEDLSKALGPQVENRRGQTPQEVVMEYIVDLWAKAERLNERAGDRDRLRGGLDYNHKLDDEKEDMNEGRDDNGRTLDRSALVHLKARSTAVPEAIGSGRRLLISMDKVQESVNVAMAQAERASSESIGRDKDLDDNIDIPEVTCLPSRGVQ